MKNENKFRLFPKRREKEDIGEEDRSPTLKFFFKLLFRRGSGLISLNLLMLFMVIPIIAGILLYITSPTTPTTLSPLYAPLYGVSLISDSPAIDIALTTVNAQLGLPVLSVARSCILIALGVFLMLTWGIQNVGAAYVLRGFFRGDAVFVFSDYFYGIRKNWKQAIGVGILDIGILTLLVIDYITMYTQMSTYVNDLMYFMVIAIAIVYFFMRFYIYQLLITFDMKWTKIYKNSLIFTILGFKRNIMAALGIFLLIGIHVLLFFLLLSFTTVPLVLALFYLLSVTAFMSVYAAYPIIDRYLIKPYEAAHPHEPDPNEEFADGFDETGTELESAPENRD